METGIYRAPLKELSVCVCKTWEIQIYYKFMKKTLPGSVVRTSTGSFPTDLPYIGTAGDDSTVQSARPVVQVLVLGQDLGCLSGALLRVLAYILPETISLFHQPMQYVGDKGLLIYSPKGP